MNHENIQNDQEHIALVAPEVRQAVENHAKDKRKLLNLPPFDASKGPGKQTVVRIQKPDGSYREACKQDVQDYTNNLHVLRGVLEPRHNVMKSKSSHGIAKGTGTHTAVNEVLEAVDCIVGAGGSPVVLQMDIGACFDSCPLDPVMELLKAPISGRILREHAEAWNKFRGTALGIGLPQGHPSSPWALDMVINSIEASVRERIEQMGGRLVRYVDDYTLVGTTIGTVLDGADLITAALRRAGFRMNPDKTRLTWDPRGSLNLLGYRIFNWGVPENRIIAPAPSKVRELVRKMTSAAGGPQRKRILQGYRAAYRLSDTGALQQFQNMALCEYGKRN